LLREKELTVRDLSRILGIREKEVLEHLPHVRRSAGKRVNIFAEPAMCLNCDYVFKDRRRFTTPGRCPVCKSERITEPVFGIKQ
jgi:predicted Zn-ribbon and HTH transcriptional regulator